LQFRFLTSVAVFIGSYVPLAAILLVQDVNYTAVGYHVCWPLRDHTPKCAIPPILSIFVLIVSLLCLLLTIVALERVRTKRQIVVKTHRYIPSELISYTLPYIVTLIAIGYDDMGKLVGLLLFMGWMFAIVYKSGQLILNPVLVVFGWRLYELEYTHAGGSETFAARALVKGLIKSGVQYEQASLQDVLVIRPGN